MGRGRAQQRWALYSLATTASGDAAALVAEFPKAQPLPLHTALTVLADSDLHPSVPLHAARKVAQAHGAAPFDDPQSSAALDHLLTKSSTTRAAFFAPPVSAGGAEWEQPRCVCTDVTVRGQLSQQVTLTFHTSRTIAEMAPYADPRTWPVCSAFWVAMTQLSLAPSKVTSVATDWAGAFEEIVEFMPGYPMTTPLLVNYRTHGLDSVHTTYSLLAETSYLDVDEGSIDLAVDPNPPAGMPTKITAVKIIHWKSAALQAAPHLVCDTMWGELGLNMASRCGL